MSDWKMQGDINAGGGYPGGYPDGAVQLGDAYELTFRNPGLPDTMVTAWVYVVEYAAKPGLFWVQVQTERLIGEDPEDLPNTETWVESVCADEHRAWPSPGEADGEALRVATNLSDGSWISWDGEPE